MRVSTNPAEKSVHGPSPGLVRLGISGVGRTDTKYCGSQPRCKQLVAKRREIRGFVGINALRPEANDNRGIRLNLCSDSPLAWDPSSAFTVPQGCPGKRFT